MCTKAVGLKPKIIIKCTDVRSVTNER